MLTLYVVAAPGLIWGHYGGHTEGLVLLVTWAYGIGIAALRGPFAGILDHAPTPHSPGMDPLVWGCGSGLVPSPHS